MEKQSIFKRAKSSKVFGLSVLTIVVIIVFSILKPAFIARGNIRTLLNDLCTIGIMLVGVVPLLISGGIDLAASAEAAFGSLVFAQLLTINSIPWGVALVLALLSGIAMGLIIVLVCKLLNLMPFIVSLGLSSIYTGFATLWTRSNNVMINRQSFLAIGKVAIGKWVPVLFIFMVVLVIFYAYLMKNTKFGREVYMIGGNPVAARLAGINAERVRAILFMNSSMMSVLAGIVWACQKKMGSPTKIQVASPNFDALTAGVLGGVSFMGGSGTLMGAFVAMLLVNVFTSGIIMLGLPSFMSIMLQGLILIIALMIDNISARRAEAAQKRAAMASGTAK